MRSSPLADALQPSPVIGWEAKELGKEREQQQGGPDDEANQWLLR